MKNINQPSFQQTNMKIIRIIFSRILLVAFLFLTVFSECYGQGQLVKNRELHPDFRKKIRLGVVYHLENWAEYDSDKYNSRLELLDRIVEIFEANAAIVTLEVKCNTKPDECTQCMCVYFNAQEKLKDYISRGHGIGLHADLCGNSDCIGVPGDCLNVSNMANTLTSLRIALSYRAGHEITHVSGVCSSLNWAEAVRKSGLLFSSGVVDFCRMSLDIKDPEYLFCESPGKCHDAYPGTIPDNLHPWLVYNSEYKKYNWTDRCSDPAKGDIGILPSFGVFINMDGDAKYNYEKDKKALFKSIDKAIDHHYGIPHFPLTHFDAITFKLNINSPNLTDLEKLLSEIKTKYVDTGKIKWSNFEDIFLAYKKGL